MELSQTLTNMTTIQSQFFTPQGQTLSTSLKRNVMVSGLVIGLLGLCRPFTVTCPSVANTFCTFATRIVGIIINAINRLFCRTLPHIGQKILKAVCPPRTDADATFAVMVKSVIARIVASIFDLKPNSIYGCARIPVGAFTQARFLIKTLATRFRFARNQVSGNHVTNRSATTFNFPPLVIITDATIALDSPLSKGKALDVSKAGMRWFSNNLSQHQLLLYHTKSRDTEYFV